MVLYLLFTLFLLLLEVFVYPGLVQKYTHVGISVFLLISIALILVQEYSFPFFIEKLILFFPLLLIPAYIYLNIQEQAHFPNYVYSQYHLSISSIQNLLIFFIVLVVSIVIRSRFFIKRFAPALKKPFYKILILLLFSVIFSSLLLKNNLNITWSIIDDHEIAYFLGSDKKILLKEIPNIISNTEVGNFGNSARFRLSYYVLRVTEAFLWKDNPHLWYFARYVILIFFLFSVSYIASNFLGIIPAIIFSLFLMTGSYWSDIWTRLGPAEIYMVLGISLYSLGILKIVEAKTRSLSPWLLFLFGGLIAIGSKENMVVLAIPSLYLLLYSLVHYKRDWKLLIPFLHILFAIFVTTSIYLATSEAGYDIHGNVIATGKILSLVIPGIRETIKDLKIIEIVLVGLLLLFSMFISSKKIYLHGFFDSHKKAIYLAIFLVFIYFTQYIFYSGKWPSGIRYDFPGILAKQLFWLVCFYLCSRLVIVFFDFQKSKVNILLYSTFFGLLFFSVINTGYHAIIQTSKYNVLASATFTRNLSTLSDLAKNHHNYPIVLKSENVWDYEPIFSLERFLRFMGVSNAIYLNYKNANLAERTVLKKNLSEELTRISKNGMSGNNTLFNQFDPKKMSTSCILVTLSGVEGNNECVLKVRIN